MPILHTMPFMQCQLCIQCHLCNSHNAISWLLYDHMMIICWSCGDHLLFMWGSSEYHLMIILWISDDYMLIIWKSYHDYCLQIICWLSECHGKSVCKYISWSSDKYMTIIMIIMVLLSVYQQWAVSSEQWALSSEHWALSTERWGGSVIHPSRPTISFLCSLQFDW